MRGPASCWPATLRYYAHFTPGDTEGPRWEVMLTGAFAAQQRWRWQPSDPSALPRKSLGPSRPVSELLLLGSPPAHLKHHFRWPRFQAQRLGLSLLYCRGVGPGHLAGGVCWARPVCSWPELSIQAG